ncbi:Oberon, PHD finger domain, partial [Dillenia turbinata]
MSERLSKSSQRGTLNLETRRTSTNTTNSQPSRKQPRKGVNPIRFPSAAGLSEHGSSTTWLCKNSACRAVLSIEDTFCRRCTCCICHLFDDNKDPSLWLFCSSEFDNRDSCGLSCHIECAIKRKRVGVVDLGQLMQLDGSYCCASCGQVSGILECWKKQLMIAKDARRIDVLSYRISLCYRLLDGTSKFKELQAFVSDAKSKLETEIGPISGVSAKMARGIVSRLSVAADVQKLCNLAIEKADVFLSTISSTNINRRADSLPAACRFLFEEVTSSSLVIVLKESESFSSDVIKGYKLWYSKSTEILSFNAPTSIFPRAQRRILISNLQPCTEYLFRIVSYTDSGDLGHSEAKCFTKSVEIVQKKADSEITAGSWNDSLQNGGISSGSEEDTKTKTTVGPSGFKVRDLGKVLHPTSAEERGCIDEFCSVDVEECCRGSGPKKHETSNEEPKSSFIQRELDLNVVSVPDLNADITPPLESSRDEDNGCTLEQAVEAEDDAISQDVEKNVKSRSNESSDSQNRKTRPVGQVPVVESWSELGRQQKLSTKSESHDCVSTLINGSPLRLCSGVGHLDGSYESSVKVIRLLECRGHITQEFRMKFLTWFSLRSTEQECRVVHTYIQTLMDDPSSLAGQLVDSFSDIITSKRPRNGFGSELVSYSTDIHGRHGQVEANKCSKR